MLAAERRRRIIQILEKDHSVRVAELCDRFDVADETIRRDLKQLEAEGLVERKHGGAVLSDRVRVAHPFHMRKVQAPIEKQRVGRAAAQLVSDGSTVILDNGTTTLEVARCLRGTRRLTVVTTSPLIALEMSGCPDITVIVTGGILDPDSQSLIGPDAEESLRKLRVDVAFVGASGVSVERGFTASNVYDAQIKSVMVSAASRPYVVADGSKIGQSSLVRFSSLREVCGLVTDSTAAAHLLDKVRESGLDVVLA